MLSPLNTMLEKSSMSMTALRLLFVFTVVLMLQGGLAGCNTIEGAGKDISAAGKAIKDTAEKTKPY